MIKSLSDNIEDYPQGIVFPIDKPYRWTSADVIRKVKYAAIRHFGKKNLKVGHAGTLDPLATGILLVCIGAATKRAEILQASPKEYLAGVSFGATTPSYDLEKEIDSTFPTDAVSEESIRALLPSMLGEQDQIAPLFSAKSVDGQRVYQMARRLLKEAAAKGEAFDYAAVGDILQANRINIYSLSLEAFESEFRQCVADDPACRIRVADVSAYKLPTATIRIGCSKGTYIRAFARDLGEALGSGAFLSSLRRTKNGGFTIEDAISLDTALSLLGAERG